MALLLYRILFPAAFLLALPFYALRLWRRERGRTHHEKPAGYQLGFGQRLGRYGDLSSRLSGDRRPWWICSISIGETLMALKLARALHAREPETFVVLSVTTSTGYELLSREAARLPWLFPIYNPIDLRFATRAAIQAIRPRALVLVEGGIWPNLLSVARDERVPVSLACARLSPRSERRWQRWPGFARAVWSLFDQVCVPEAADIARFTRIGVVEKRLVHTGSLKFDNATSETQSRESEFRSLVTPLGFTGAILVAGSTWAPEEKLLSEILGNLRRTHPNLRLIVVPRHVERADDVERQFAGWNVARRSRLPASGPTDVILVDTTGELRDWYRLGTVVFVGKSMPGVAEIGGQNAGEPAALGLPVVFGPHMENFSGLVAHLKRQDAAVMARDPQALASALTALLADPARRAAMGERARAALLQHQGATERTAAALIAAVR
jgi:3-deoxy-D-manno-octulosonic-acid transferase